MNYNLNIYLVITVPPKNNNSKDLFYIKYIDVPIFYDNILRARLQHRYSLLDNTFSKFSGNFRSYQFLKSTWKLRRHVECLGNSRV